MDDWFWYLNSLTAGISLGFFFFGILFVGLLKNLAEEMGDRKKRRWTKQRKTKKK